MLNLTIDYTMGNEKTPNRFAIGGNIKNDKAAEIIGEFIRSEIGEGPDDSPPNEKDVYRIELDLRLSDDTFFVRDDCGNKGLRTGILMDVMRRLADLGQEV